MTDLILTDEDGTPIKKDSVRRRILRNIEIKEQYNRRLKHYKKGRRIILIKRLAYEYSLSSDHVYRIIKGTNY